MPKTFRVTALLCAGLLALVALPFWPGLSGGFIFDDYPNIVQQPAIQLDTFELAQLMDAMRSFTYGSGRPLAMLSLALDHIIWGGDSFGFKLTGLLVHLVNTVLVFLLLGTLLKRVGVEHRTSALCAFALALTWAIHPLQVSTVLYVVQRMETLSTSFVLLALMSYLHGRCRQIEGLRGWPWLALSAVVTVAAVSTKESAIILPVYTLALEFTILGFGAKSHATRRNLKAAYLLGLLLAVALAALAAPAYVSEAAYSVRDFTALERVLTQFRVLPMYLGWILLPQPGNYVFYYDNFAYSTGLLAPASTLAGLVLVLALIVLAFRLRHRVPLFALGVLWFFAAHAVTSSFLALELVFEHRNYFAILGVVLTIFGIVQKTSFARKRKLVLAASIPLLCTLLALTAIRSAEWGSPLQLAMQLAEGNPGSPRASFDLGEQYMFLAQNDADSRFYAMAEQEFKRGAALPDSSAVPEQGLVVLAAAAGKEADPEWWDSMIRKLNTRTIGPQEMSMITGLLRLRDEGLALDDKRLSEAYVVLAERALMPPTQYFSFGTHALFHLDDPELARQLFQLAVDHSADHPELVEAMVGHLVEKGENEAAFEMAGYAEASKPSNARPADGGGKRGDEDTP